MASRSNDRWAFRLLATLALGAVTAGVVFVGCENEGSLGNNANVATSGAALTAAEVERILVRAVSHANARNQSAAIAVTDREGEVLGVYLMNPRDTNGDGIIDTPSAANVATAIAKAATASAFQSEGEAFTTRTAFFIVQGNYPPAAANTPAGPLFGVQDSGLASGDAHIIAFDKDGNAVGAGIAGEFGGVPLYKTGSPVGGIGVDTVSPVQTLTGPNGTGSAATLVVPVQVDIDEEIARAGAGTEFDTPAVIQATNVFVDGQQFPFYDIGTSPVNPTSIAPTLSAFPANIGAVVAQFPVRASPLAAEVRTGTEYGIRPTHRFLGRRVARSATNFIGSLTTVAVDSTTAFLSSATLTFQNVPIVALPTANVAGGINEVRAVAIDSIEPPPAESGLTAAEVNAIIANAVGDARRSVAGIRLPRGSSVTVHVAVVDVRGNLLALHRMADGTLFSSDIAVQKARTCAFFSSDSTQSLPTVAFSARGIGFLSQPFFPPGLPAGTGIGAGPLVYFRDLINRGKLIVEDPPSNRLINPPPRLPSDGTTDEDPINGGNQFFNDFAGAAPAELSAIRTLISNNGGINLLADRPDASFISPGLQSGLMTFPGGVPLYRGTRLIGAVGVSGDGVDEDDSAAFAGATGFQPPRGTRCDEVSEQAMAQVLTSKINTIVAAIQAHPDLRIRNVYGPIMVTERNRFQQMLSRGFDRTRIPYIKLPRNPQRF